MSHLKINRRKSQKRKRSKINSLKMRIKNKLNLAEKEPNVVVMAIEIKGKNPQGKMKTSKSVLKKKTSFNSES